MTEMKVKASTEHKKRFPITEECEIDACKHFNSCPFDRQRVIDQHCPHCLIESTVICQGTKFDKGKVRYELLAPEALEGTAKILTFGAAKYSDRNWEKGMKYSRIFGALMRHLWAWWRGESFDPETQLSHLHHAACCIMFLQTYEARGVGEDDRAITHSSSL